MPQPEITFARYFADLPDPRRDRTKWHRLDDILVIALCAVICGAHPAVSTVLTTVSQVCVYRGTRIALSEAKTRT